MADSKITALDNLTSADPANDMIPIVDVSATPPASGNTKRISINNLLACSPSATLASATITGDLTVDTSTLKVDSANNRVGIVQATPLYPLHLVGEFGLEEASPAGTGSKLRFIGDATKYNFRIGKQLNVSNGFEITPSTTLGGATFSNPVYTVTNDGIHTFLDGAGGTRMTLNSTGLGVGVSPNTKLAVTHSDVVGTLYPIITAQYAAGTYGGMYAVRDGAGDQRGLAWQTYKAGTGLVESLRLSSDGNCGIGVTPSAWTTTFGLKASQVYNSALASNGTSGFLTNNAYYAGAGYTPTYISASSTPAQGILFNSTGANDIRFVIGAAGTAGNTIAGFSTAAMTLDASGRLILLASTTTPATLATNGELTFTATSNTNLRFSYRGSDGVTRTADLTLA